MPVGTLFGPNSLSGIEASLLLYRSEQDDTLSYPYHAGNIHRNLIIEHEYRIEKEAGHYSYISPFPPSLEGLVGPASRYPEGFDRTSFHNRLKVEIKSFFDRVLDL